ncbi:MAG: pyridoxamine 5'-phosphate oxidase family protein [Chloroflexi bacterium]|nr:MAG: pyridoxamine 5'-phosphate oxidase family protein [Chloroflexota bacterium]TMG62609.1 MAG: pyridoxamine 5'-phosphate oxidase family protein [Chloroflexota bacterium]
MSDAKPEPQLEEIREAECLEVLAGNRLGRIAVVVGGQPLIFPVNYALSGRIIVFRTAAGSKLFNAPEARVAFEIDGYDEQTGVGWSVMVQGIAHDATESYDDISWAAHAVLPRPMAPGPKPYQVAIEPTSITGRRFSGPGSD